MSYFGSPASAGIIIATVWVLAWIVGSECAKPMLRRKKAGQ